MNNRMKKHFQDVYGFEEKDAKDMSKFFKSFKAEDLPDHSGLDLDSARDVVNSVVGPIADEILNLHCADIEKRMEDDEEISFEMSAVCASSADSPEIHRVRFRDTDGLSPLWTDGGLEICAASVAAYLINCKSVPAVVGVVTPSDPVKATVMSVSSHVKQARMVYGEGGIDCHLDDWREANQEEGCDDEEDFCNIVFGIINAYIEGKDVAIKVVEAAPKLSDIAVFGQV